MLKKKQKTDRINRAYRACQRRISYARKNGKAIQRRDLDLRVKLRRQLGIRRYT